MLVFREGHAIATKSAPLPPRDLSWHLAQAAALDLPGLRKAIRGRMRRADFRGTVVYLQALYDQEPSAETCLELAQMHRRCRSYHLCLTHLRAALDRWPGHADILRSLAETCMLAGEFGRGAECWGEVVALEGAQGPYPVLRQIACYRQIGAHQQAAEILTAHRHLLRSQLDAAAVDMLGSGRKPDGELRAGLYLISGNNGTGKTTVGHFLQALGYRIIDADTEIASFCRNGLCSDVRYDLTRGAPEAESHTTWCWPDYRFAAIRAAAQRAGEARFVIGGYGGIVAGHVGQFSRAFHLIAPTEVIAKRLAKRGSPSHKVGSRGYEAALRRNDREAAPKYTAVVLRSDRPVWAICADIIDAAHPAKAAKP